MCWAFNIKLYSKNITLFSKKYNCITTMDKIAIVENALYSKTTAQLFLLKKMHTDMKKKNEKNTSENLFHSEYKTKVSINFFFK